MGVFVPLRPLRTPVHFDADSGLGGLLRCVDASSIPVNVEYVSRDISLTGTQLERIDRDSAVSRVVPRARSGWRDWCVYCVVYWLESTSVGWCWRFGKGNVTPTTVRCTATTAAIANHRPSSGRDYESGRRSCSSAGVANGVQQQQHYH